MRTFLIKSTILVDLIKKQKDIGGSTMNNTFSKTILALVLIATAAIANVPQNNLDGAGGIAFNPLAYTSGLAIEDFKWITKPQVGVWYVRLSESDIDWSSLSVSLTVAERVELSYAYNLVNATKYGDNDIESNSIGAKIRILDENAFDTVFVPAISIGAVYRHTDSNTTDAFNLKSAGVKYYAVATKLITQLPLPVLVSGGLQVSDEVVFGVVGHKHYDLAFFANVDVLPAENVAIGVEYQQGIKPGSNLENADYWDAHVAWFVNSQLTLVGAYVNTGNRKKGFEKLGVGEGFVLSAQYQF